MKISLKQYQHLISLAKRNNDVVEATALQICYLFDLNESEVNNFTKKQFEKYVKKLVIKKPRFTFRKLFETDAKTITLGQFIECVEWLKKPLPESTHMVAASILRKKTTHQKDAAKILEMPAKKVIFDVEIFVDSFNKLFEEYEWLFRDEEAFEGETEIEKARRRRGTHPFIKQFGWLYSATQVAEHNRISLNEAYKLPIIQALNDLCFLKSKGQYIEWQQKKLT